MLCAAFHFAEAALSMSVLAGTLAPENACAENPQQLRRCDQRPLQNRPLHFRQADQCA
jgi:hypothetical protein